MGKLFTLNDLLQECDTCEGHHCIDGQRLGLKIFIPQELYSSFPFNVTVYDFIQQLRGEIFEYGIIEMPSLPFNRCNYTLSQKDPTEHSYSQNSYTTDFCQAPHQDTPPYPTAFGLLSPRKHSATWVMKTVMLERFYQYQAQHRSLSVDELHQQLIQKSLDEGSSILVNQEPGLLLIDNSDHQSLYHARTSLVDQSDRYCKIRHDSPVYAFNEIGLLNYIDSLDEHRGDEFRSESEKQRVIQFLESEDINSLTR